MICAKVKIYLYLGCFDKYLSIKNDENHPDNVHPGNH
jgi:hypothetical protein